MEKELELTEEEKSSMLINYLGDFAMYFDDSEEELFRSKLMDLDNCVIRADDYNLLKKAICYILLSLNKKIRYINIKSNDVIDAMLNPDDDYNGEAYSFRDFQNIPLLLVYHPKIWKRNKILWETLNYLAETRKKEGKRTIFFSDAVNLRDDNGSLIVDNIINLTSTPNLQSWSNTNISSFVGSDCSSNGLYD